MPLASNNITFRHPLLLEDNGRQKRPVCLSVATFSDDDRKKIKLDIARLCSLAPDKEDDERLGLLHATAKSAYFDALKRSPKHKKAAPRKLHIGLDGGMSNDLYKRALGAEARVAELEAFILKMQQEARVSSDEENKMPLSACVEHFRTHFRCRGSQEWRDDVVRRVELVAKQIGIETKFGDITLHAVEDAVIATNSAEEGEAFKKRQAIKRFFKWLRRRKNEGGLGFANNPTENMYVGSVEKIQKKRIRKDGGISILSPIDILALKLTPFHRALFALLGYSGARLSEAARLKWGDIDWGRKMIHLPGEKTDDSYRWCKPFLDIWPLLEEWQKASEGTKDENLVFARATTGGTWIVPYKGRDRCTALTHFCRDELKRRGWADNSKPATRLRHWWCTTMDANGMGDLERLMSGHSRKTAHLHYVQQERVVSTCEVGFVSKPPKSSPKAKAKE